MSSLKQPPSNPCEAIKQCLSAKSCSSSTVLLLTETLSPQAAPAAAAGGKPLSSRQTKKQAAPRARQTALDSSQVPQLTILDRSKLAVEVINTALRNLSDIAKSSNAKPSGEPSSDESIRKRTASDAEAMRSLPGAGSAASLGSPDAVDHLADCCNKSISFLISIESSEGVPSMQLLQTENARLSLSSKLIQLGRFEGALHELNLLKQRLLLAMQTDDGSENQPMGGRKGDKPAASRTTGKPRSKAGGGLAAVGAEPGLSDLLEFPEILASSPAFPLAIAYQLGVLRCVSGLKRTDIVDVRRNMSLTVPPKVY